MADEVINNKASPPPLSFKGRLDLENFKFRTDMSPPPKPTTPRRSSRLSTSPSKTVTPTHSSVGSQLSVSTARKRKACTLADASPQATTFTALPDGTTEAEAEDSAPSASSTPPTPGTITKARKKAKDRPKAGYAPPSVYAHLPLLPDALAPNLLVLFCGLNPGVRTAQTGHAYNHPSNRFWKLMYSSGVLPVPVPAEEDRTLPQRFSLGLTNIVSRPSRNGSELSKAEMDKGVSLLEEKVRRWRPEAFCVVGKSIWESVWRERHGSAIKKHDFRYGWQDEGENIGRGEVKEGERVEGVVYREDWKGARVFVATSTSGLAATPRPEEKESIWRELGEWVERRRAEREMAAQADGKAL